MMTRREVKWDRKRGKRKEISMFFINKMINDWTI